MRRRTPCPRKAKAAAAAVGADVLAPAPPVPAPSLLQPGWVLEASRPDTSSHTGFLVPVGRVDRVARRGVTTARPFRRSRGRQAATAGSLTMGSSLNGAIVSRLMYRALNGRSVVLFKQQRADETDNRRRGGLAVL